ncbi:hypothetical protein [Clostridium thermobutyricum]|uniref:Plasmid replication protein RepL domain-containing protein n=1 Tax=Clostridium thermobutyricum DSM 4928 TaxID=1121339 RepID=A0A1V4SRJ4_9CLOT|nr:hypothetical protein [Clostridium thermobutyricum]OPX46474.1 hypothetical protein CLTHE_28680 [Clostridium thermobutyricum DSM 4928]
MSFKGKKLIRETTNYTSDLSGNITQLNITTEQYIPREEPDFIKLYLDHVLVHKDVSIKMSPILFEICKLSTYADNQNGGMMIFLNKFTKEQIRNNLGYKSIKMVEKAIDNLFKNQIILRKGRGAYILNPYFFGKGNWSDIKKIRATIDFNSGEFIPHLEFDVRDSNGKLLDGYIENEDGDIVNISTGEIIKSIS